MEQLKEIFMNARQIVEFAELKGWSEEELAKVINVLHSEIKEVNYLS